MERVGIGFYSPKTLLSWFHRTIINSDYTDVFLSINNEEGEFFVYERGGILIYSSPAEIKKKWCSLIVYEPMCYFKDSVSVEISSSLIEKSIKEPLYIFIAKTLQSSGFPLAKRLNLKTLNKETLRRFVDHSIFFRIREVESSSLVTSFTLL
jgi:hypothetical protein